MKDKNYIEQITNLERSMEKYVPKRMYDALIEEYEISESANDDKSVLQLHREITSLKELANKEAVELYTLDTQDGNKVTTTKRPINICPYCGDKMVLAWDDGDSRRNWYRSMYSRRERPADFVVFSCLLCGAQSPRLNTFLKLFDESVIATEMGQVINRAIWEKEHGGDEDEEYKED